MKKRLFQRGCSLAIGAAMISSGIGSLNISALVTDPAGDYDNFAKALQYSLYFYDANMCGTDVGENNRFAWRDDCHSYDSEVPLKPMGEDSIGTNLSQSFIDKYYDILNTGTKEGTVNVQGGFHDAGDHVKFGMPEAYAASTVAWGYYEFRDAYVETEQDSHVETIIRYFSDYFMRSTFRDENGDVICFCYQVGDGDIDHSYWNMPEVDEMARPAWFATADNPTTCNVTQTSAALAIAYLDFKDTDPEYAEKCLDYAIALYDFANKNEKKKADTEQGPKGYYGSSKWEDDYCFASAWLYLITGEKQYITNALPVLDFYAAPSYTWCWNDAWNGVDLLMARISETYKSDTNYSADDNPKGLSDLAMDYITVNKKSKYEDINFWYICGKAYHSYMNGSPGELSPQGYWWMDTWGSARYNTAGQFTMLVYDKYRSKMDVYDVYNKAETGSDSEKGFFAEWAKGQMEYILGNNDITYLESSDGEHGPRNFIVGFDESSVKYPHHRAASGLTKCEDTDQQLHVLFGALAGGPDNADGHNDVTKDWIYNEVTIDYNAALPGAAAGLYLKYKDQYKQAITENFPPENDGGRGANTSDEAGGSSVWAEACGVDDLNANGCGVTKISVMVKANSIKNLNNMTVRYYFDTSEIKNFSGVTASKLYDQVSAEVTGKSTTLSQPVKWDKDSKYAYVELSWDDYTFANSGKKYQFTLGMYYGDTWDPTNDPSYQDLKMYSADDAFAGTGNEVKNDHICIYSDGVLVGGIEPDGTTPVVTTTTTTTTEGKTTTTTLKTTVTGKTEGTTTYGDANCDEKVNISDLVFLNSVFADTQVLSAQGKINADVDGDGEQTTLDLSSIAKYLCGSIPYTALNPNK